MFPAEEVRARLAHAAKMEKRDRAARCTAMNDKRRGFSIPAPLLDDYRALRRKGTPVPIEEAARILGIDTGVPT